MGNKVEDLRNILFAQLERLSSDENFKTSTDQDREIKRTASMIDVAKTLIDSARAETESLKVATMNDEALSSSFFDEASDKIDIPTVTKKLEQPTTEQKPIKLKQIDADQIRQQSMCSHKYGFDYEPVEKGLKRTCKKCGKAFIETKAFTEDDAIQKNLGIIEKEINSEKL